MRTTRLERKVAEVRGIYETWPELERARFERSLRAAYDALKQSSQMPATMKRALLELAGMVISDGVVGGDWAKVHLGISQWPELYERVRDIIPKGRGDALAL